MRSIGLVSGFIMAFLFAQVQAKDLAVPGDCPTIQKAIDSAKEEDRILVSPGIYYENIDFLGKAIHVLSVNGSRKTIIDGSRGEHLTYGSVATFRSGEPPQAILEGFTLRRGVGYLQPNDIRTGGGLLILQSSPTITNNAIVENEVPAPGGGILVFGSNSSASIVQNSILRNRAEDGAGIYVAFAGRVAVARNVIANNVAENQAGGLFFETTGGFVANNLIVDNTAIQRRGGGLVTGFLTSRQFPQPYIVNNTIANNKAPRAGGLFAGGFGPTFRVVNNIIYGNQAEDGTDDIGQILDAGRQYYSHCNIGVGGECVGKNGNISADPLFANPEDGDYSLLQGSPCIDAGNNEIAIPELPDLHGYQRIADGDSTGTAIVDIGAIEHSPVALGKKPNIEFIRGDANGDGKLGISDAIAVVRYLTEGRQLPCEDTADANDDGTVDIADPIYILGVLFDGTAHLPALCQPDITGDALGCDTYTSCP